MPHYYIEANATPRGEYQAPTKMQALHAYAIDTGYDDYIARVLWLLARYKGDEICWEIDTKALVAAVEQKTGLACCQPSFGGVVQQGGTVHETWELFAEYNGFLIQDFFELANKTLNNACHATPDRLY